MLRAQGARGRGRCRGKGACPLHGALEQRGGGRGQSVQGPVGHGQGLAFVLRVLKTSGGV